MNECFVYWIMNSLGYRRFYYDYAFIRGINLESFEGWLWRPWTKEGTYREMRKGFKFCGYGVDK